MNIFDEVESNVRTYCRQFPAVFDWASGHHVRDDQGRLYLDFLVCAGALNYGHNPPAVVEAVIAYLRGGGIVSSLDFQTSAKAAFLTSFRDVILAPRRLDYVIQCTGPTGTNAVEAALKLARLATGRTNVVAFSNAFHGVSTGALAATANARNRRGAGMPLAPVARIPYEGYVADVDGLTVLEAMLEDSGSGLDRPAAIIVETVQGEGGLRAASAEWLQRLQQIARRSGALLIVDDIQAGCGRTGTFFSFEDHGIEPDIVCLSKSISAMGLPMALVLLRRQLDVWEPGQHNGTFRGNNLAFVAARTAIETYWTTGAFGAAVRSKASLLEDLLTPIVRRFACRGARLRGRGMMRGIVFDDPDFAQAVSKAAFAHGLIAETCGPRDEVLKLLPPLTIDEAGISKGVTLLRRAIEEVDRAYAPLPVQQRLIA
jgi:diaminobutyrate-2-oxoglutarate transaminase